MRGISSSEDRFVSEIDERVDMGTRVINSARCSCDKVSFVEKKDNEYAQSNGSQMDD